MRHLRRPEAARALFHEYPVLARQLTIALESFVACSLSFLERLCADWEAIRAAFSPDEDPGVLVAVAGGIGDKHRGGQSVLIATFRSGLRVVYKPRSLGVDVHVQELLEWLNARGDHPPFRTLTILDRGHYGWVEFVAARACASADEVRRFYERQGGYLALLHALAATDFHHENLIAAGEHPVLIDLETLFHPLTAGTDLTGPEFVADRAMADSVLRIGLLPHRVWGDDESEGVDISGLGAIEGQLTPRGVPSWEAAGTDEMRFTRRRRPIPSAQNRPTLEGARVEVQDHAGDIARGFASVYRLLMEHRDELLADEGPLARFARDEVRVVLRATNTYALLLFESFHPDLLRDALERDRCLDRLWVAVEHRPALARVVAAERDALLNGDIPLFTTQPRLAGPVGRHRRADRRFPGRDRHGPGPSARGPVRRARPGAATLVHPRLAVDAVDGDEAGAGARHPPVGTADPRRSRPAAGRGPGRRRQARGDGAARRGRGLLDRPGPQCSRANGRSCRWGWISTGASRGRPCSWPTWARSPSRRATASWRARR